jgi:hypothetical protein
MIQEATAIEFYHPPPTFRAQSHLRQTLASLPQLRRLATSIYILAHYLTAHNMESIDAQIVAIGTAARNAKLETEWIIA